MSILTVIRSMGNHSAPVPPAPPVPISEAMRITDFYCDLAGVSSDDRSKIKNRMLELDNAGLFVKLTALWLFVGSSLSNKLFNLVDPDSEEGAFPLSLPEGHTVTSHTHGIAMHSNADKIDTNIFPTMLGYVPSVGVSYYLRTADSRGLFDSEDAFFSASHYETGFSYVIIQGGEGVGIPVSGGNKARLWTLQRTNATKINSFNSGTRNGEVTDNAGSISDGNSIKLKFNDIFDLDPKVLSMAALHEAFTDAEAVTFNTIISGLMSDLGRAI